METPTNPTIRELMPNGFTRVLMRRTGCSSDSRISKDVMIENRKSTLWPAIEELAKETNPEGFAKWQQAHQQPSATA